MQTELPAATPYTTAELSLTFLRPVHAGPNIVASGQAIHVGRSVGLSEAFLSLDAPERLLAHGTSRLSIMPARDDIPPPPDDMPVFEPPAFDTPDPYLREIRRRGHCRRRSGTGSIGLEVVARQVAG